MIFQAKIPPLLRTRYQAYNMPGYFTKEMKGDYKNRFQNYPKEQSEQNGDGKVL